MSFQVNLGSWGSRRPFRAILCFCWLLFYVLHTNPCQLQLLKNILTLFCCEAPEMFDGPLKLHPTFAYMTVRS